MTYIFRFARTLARHSAPYVLVSVPAADPDDAYDEDGVYVPPVPAETPLRGSIQPLTARWLQMDGGKYTEDDRVLYTVSTHRDGDIILYQGKRYTVGGEGERPDYTDYNKYLLKRVTTHDSV